MEGYRFLLVLRGPGLAEGLTDTDPQREGMEPFPAVARVPEAALSARLVNEFIEKARAMLKGRTPATC